MNDDLYERDKLLSTIATLRGELRSANERLDRQAATLTEQNIEAAELQAKLDTERARNAELRRDNSAMLLVNENLSFAVSKLAAK